LTSMQMLNWHYCQKLKRRVRMRNPHDLGSPAAP
jgi:hypothetical protein